MPYKGSEQERDQKKAYRAARREKTKAYNRTYRAARREEINAKAAVY